MVVGGRELIDTLWNVNDNLLYAYVSCIFRINRYIMECKLSARVAEKEGVTAN